MREIPKIEKLGYHEYFVILNQWAKEAVQQIKTLEKYSEAQEEENQRNQQEVKIQKSIAFLCAKNC